MVGTHFRQPRTYAELVKFEGYALSLWDRKIQPGQRLVRIKYDVKHAYVPIASIFSKTLDAPAQVRSALVKPAPALDP
jgi:hypothetical protein